MKATRISFWALLLVLALHTPAAEACPIYVAHDWTVSLGDRTFGLVEYRDVTVVYLFRPVFRVPLSAPVTAGALSTLGGLSCIVCFWHRRD